MSIGTRKHAYLPSARRTSSASTSGSSTCASRLPASTSCQVSGSSSLSVAPAGLGYCATSRSSAAFRKKNATPTGI